MVGRRGEAPLVPLYKFRRPNKAIALSPPSSLVAMRLRSWNNATGRVPSVTMSADLFEFRCHS